MKSIDGFFFVKVAIKTNNSWSRQTIFTNRSRRGGSGQWIRCYTTYRYCISEPEVLVGTVKHSGSCSHKAFIFINMTSCSYSLYCNFLIICFNSSVKSLSRNKPRLWIFEARFLFEMTHLPEVVFCSPTVANGRNIMFKLMWYHIYF